MAMLQLKRSKLFKKVAPEGLRILSPLGHLETYAPGSIIFAQNSLAEKVYLLEHGVVALKTSLSDGLEITFEMITKKGDLFGWSALVEPFLLTATAICLEKTQVIAFRQKDLDRVFERQPDLGFMVMKNLCFLIARRLHRSRQLLAGQV